MTQQLPLDKRDSISLLGFDASGNTFPFVPDSPPIFTNSNPTVASGVQVSGTSGSQQPQYVLTPLVSGSTLISVSLTVSGVPFSTSETENVVNTGTPVSVSAETTWPASDSGTLVGTGRELRITFGSGAKYVFSETTQGTVKDHYVGAFVSTDRVEVKRPNFPLTVIFMSDLTGPTRDQVIVENGRDLDGLAALHILNSYTYEFFKNGSLLHSETVPVHWRFSRWRWPRADRPVVRSITSAPLGYFPPINSGSPVNQTLMATGATYVNPMDKAHLLFDSSTGERPEIGPCTEYQANYILTQGSLALTTIMAQAEACATAPIHYRDHNTGLYVNHQTRPHASTNGASTKDWINKGPSPQTSTGAADPRYMSAETSHTPSLAWMPYWLTDDPYYLEELQALGALATSFSDFYPGLYGIPGLVTTEQNRGFGWSIRAIFQNILALGMITTVPNWLLPLSYQQWVLNQNLIYVQRCMASPARCHAFFRLITVTSVLHKWQNSFISAVIGIFLTTGQFNAWRPFYDWFIKGFVDQWGGMLGWNVSDPSPYTSYIRTDGKNSTYIPDTSQDQFFAVDYTQAWALHKAAIGLNDAGLDPNKLYNDASGAAYLLYMHGVLVVGIANGHGECTPILNSLHARWNAVYNFNGTLDTDVPNVQNYSKWAF